MATKSLLNQDKNEQGICFMTFVATKANEMNVCDLSMIKLDKWN